MIANKEMQSIIAKSLTNVEFLNGIFSKRIALRDDILEKIEPSLADISNFAAFIGMVQNNFLWTDFSATRKLMRAYELELDVFSAYLNIHQQNKRSGLKTEERISAFINFLQTYLRDDVMIHNVILSSLKHENAMRILRLAKDGERQSGIVEASMFRNSKTTFTTNLSSIITLKYSPDIIETLLAKPGDILKYADTRRNKTFCYWVANGKVRVCEISAKMGSLVKFMTAPKTFKELKSKFKNMPHLKEAMLMLGKNNIIRPKYESSTS